MNEPLFELDLQVTNKCNQQCIYCCFNSQINSTDKLHPNHIRNFLDFITKFKSIDEIHITGGEPLLRGDIFKILKICRKYANSVTVLTNGTVELSKIKKLKSYINRLRITLNSLNQKHHAYISASNTKVEQISNSIIASVDNGIPVELATILMKENEKDILDILKFADENKISRIIFYSLIPIGRGVNLRNQILSFSTKKKIIKKVINLKKRIKYPKDICFEFEYAPKKYMNKFRKYENVCLINPRRYLFLSYDGSIYPCGLLFNSEFSLGNIIMNEKWKKNVQRVLTKQTQPYKRACLLLIEEKVNLCPCKKYSISEIKSMGLV